MVNSFTDRLPESHIRLFLSVDVEGSSALKTARNHSKLLRIYKDSRKSIHELVSDGLLRTNFDLDDPTQYLPSILRSFPREEWDWASILTARFKDFHIGFVQELSKMGWTDPDDLARRHLWKLLGDELVYCFKVEKREHLHSYVVAFLQVLRRFDKEDVQANIGIRVKGSGWIAGFPVRNRVVDLPAPELYWRDAEGLYHPHEYPRTDYLGPEMDTGFRISKFAHPGFMVVSFDLAELLGQVQTTTQVRAAIVGWEVLKGVWNEKPYPIIWIAPHECLGDDHKEFLPWSESTNPLSSKWSELKEEEKIFEIKELAPVLQETRKRLASSLGIVSPYIPQEPHPTPIDEDHKAIRKILEALPDSEEARATQEGVSELPDTAEVVTLESARQLVANESKGDSL
jgi:hypothetical protein